MGTEHTVLNTLLFACCSRITLVDDLAIIQITWMVPQNSNAADDAIMGMLTNYIEFEESLASELTLAELSF